jgi:DNA-binding NarL/FixJ family response regulator
MSAAAAPPIRVLLVDDDPAFAELIAFVLRVDAGAEVVGHAWDGVEGVELAGTLRPDVVVMDLRMPRMDGFEATRRIADTVRGTHVVVVSSSTEREDVERAHAAGAAGYVPKDRAVAELPGELGRLRSAKQNEKRRSLSLFFARRLVFG